MALITYIGGIEVPKEELKNHAPRLPTLQKIVLDKMKKENKDKEVRA